VPKKVPDCRYRP